MALEERFYRIADGRVWSTGAADWVDSGATARVSGEIIPVMDGGIPGDETVLRTAILEFYGYPTGTVTPPEDRYNAARAVVYRKYERPYDGASGGILNLARMTHAAAMMEVPQDPEKLAGISSQYQVELANMKAEYDAIDEQYGVN